jgi:hypothetical protein
MAISGTLTEATIFGNLRVKIGSYSGTSTSGTIATGLNKIFYATAQSGANATSPIVTVSGGTISLTVASGDSGMWMAIGL